MTFEDYPDCCSRIKKLRSFFVKKKMLSFISHRERLSFYLSPIKIHQNGKHRKIVPKPIEKRIEKYYGNCVTVYEFTMHAMVHQKGAQFLI